MDLYKNLETLGKAFAEGEIDALAGCLNENCGYHSDYAHKRISSAEGILKHMRSVSAMIREQVENGEDHTYSCQIIRLDSVFKHGVKLEDLPGTTVSDVYEKGLLLYQCGGPDPVSVVFIRTNPDGQITEINLSRNHAWFDLHFYDEDRLENSEEGIPHSCVRVNNSADRIQEAAALPFEGGERKKAECIRTDERERGDGYADIPALTAVEPLRPVFTERFALKLTFDNGEIKKYVLPIDAASEKERAVSFRHHVFTDQIWSAAKAGRSGEAHCGMAVRFANGFSISALKCYEEGSPYSEPELLSGVVYEDPEYTVTRCWRWNVNVLCGDAETGLVRTLISGDAFNDYGVSTFASRDGKRLCSIDFSYIDRFHEGRALVGKNGYGYGFVDEQMNLIIPMIYEQADAFRNGRAKVRRNGKWMFVDTRGNELEIKSGQAGAEYQDVGEFHEGMCRVSILKLDFTDLAYHSDDSENAGIWGFINEAGKEIIAPQYIYAGDFCGGAALVCKGKWTIDRKWDNQSAAGLYWTEEELWGAIDKAGNEVIPFVFDEIKYFRDMDDVLMAHCGGWDSGHWGVIDHHGNWLADPVFEDIDDEYRDGLFAFYQENRWNGDVPLGIYDLKQHKMIFEPQFFSVSFREDGWIKVEVFDKALGRNVQKLIDRNGHEKFRSFYSQIHTWKKPYEVMVRDENGERHGLIDEDGTVLLPCEYDVPWAGISHEQELMIFQSGDRQGIRDFHGHVIVEPKYYEICGIDRPMVIVRVGEKNHYKEGLITKTGREVIPAVFRTIRLLGDQYFACCRDGLCEVYKIDKR